MPRDTLILLPGLMCDAAVYAPQLEGLADVCEPRVVEHGPRDSLVDMARHVLRVAPPRFALAGHSMGGRVAFEVLRQAPGRVSRVALLSTACQARPEGEAGEREAAGRRALLDLARREGTAAMAREWIKGMLPAARQAEAALVEPIVAMFGRSSAERFAAQIRALLDRPGACEVLSTLRVPTLVLAGRDDAWNPPAVHEDMARRVPGGARLVLLEGCAHMCTLEQPAAVNAALRDWLAS
jgi:pimeloyl-ACP methyl ester carboxylesterase